MWKESENCDAFVLGMPLLNYSLDPCSRMESVLFPTSITVEEGAWHRRLVLPLAVVEKEQDGPYTCNFNRLEYLEAVKWHRVQGG